MARQQLPELGEAIESRRRARGWSMEKLADEAGLAVGTIRAAERGHPPNVLNLILVAGKLGATVGELLGEHAPDFDRRLDGLAALAADLTDSDIAALTSLARQIASRPQPTALPAELDHVEGIDALTEGERRAVLRGIELRDKAARLAGQQRTDQAAGGRNVGEGRRPRRQRSSAVD